jgi:hypothetical protein
MCTFELPETINKAKKIIGENYKTKNKIKFLKPLQNMTSSGEREALTSTVERLLPALASP